MAEEKSALALRVMTKCIGRSRMHGGGRRRGLLLGGAPARSFVFLGGRAVAAQAIVRAAFIWQLLGVKVGNLQFGLAERGRGG